MKVRLKVPLSAKRVFIGALLAALGILLVLANRYVIGGAIIMTGLVVGIRGSYQAIYLAFAFALSFSLFLGFFYWMETANDTRTFAEWSDDSVAKYVILGVYLLVIFVTVLLDNASSWRVLERDYSEIGDWKARYTAYPVRTGALGVYGDLFSVSVVATEAGMLISKSDRDCLFFDWTKVESIRIPTQAPHTAEISIVRKTPLPLKMTIPWDDRFFDHVPDRLRTLAA